MPRIVFTSHLQRHIACPPVTVEGDSVRAALEAVFAAKPLLRGYILDEQGQLRKHVLIAVDGEIIRDRLTLSDPVADSAEIYILQALSGG